MHEIIVEPPAERFIKSLNKKEQTKLFDSLESLQKSPKLGKKLVGKLKGLRSWKVENYRVVYLVEDTKLIVVVLRAGHGRDIYTKALRK